MTKDLINSKQELYYKLALIINLEMYESGRIPFNVFKRAEDKLLKKVKCESN